MKKYIGTKQIEATPMTLGEFIEKTGRNPYEKDCAMHNDAQEGYLVKYKDGYESWSPKDVFEEAYHEGTMKDVSDGYHTFKELYRYRMLYNAAFFNELAKIQKIKVCKSHKHNNGELCFGGGWFIVMAELPTGQISNHYEDSDWDLFNVPELETAWKWDGHTPQEAATRLTNYLSSSKGDFKDRLYIELEDLKSKLEKLVLFNESGKVDEVVKDNYQKFLLRLQQVIMGNYVETLECRIKCLGGAPILLTQMSFGVAIEALKFGCAIRRSGWNGKGMFVVKQVPSAISETIIPGMQSLPQSAKDLLMARENKAIWYCNQMLIIHPDGRADSWVPSSSDIFANDWEIVKC